MQHSVIEITNIYFYLIMETNKFTGSIVINFDNADREVLHSIYRFLNDKVYEANGIKYRTYNE